MNQTIKETSNRLENYKNNNDHNCIVLDHYYMDIAVKKPLSIYFNRKFQTKPNVVVSLSGLAIESITPEKPKSVDNEGNPISEEEIAEKEYEARMRDKLGQDIQFKKVEKADIYLDHFDIMIISHSRWYKIPEIKICYFAVITDIFD